MSKERAPRISRRAFLSLAAAVGAGIASHEIEKRLSSFQSTSLSEFSPKEIEKFKDAEALLVFFPGGWGNTSLKEDHNWQEILLKVKEELENRGYKTSILEEFRQETLLPSLSAARSTAMKMRQLTESLPGLKIILTGRSTGASFIESVLKALPENNQILAIEAGRPFEKRIPLVDSEKTLVIENLQFDPLEEGDIWGILKSSSVPRVFIGRGGDFGIGGLRIDFHLPSHHNCCSWNRQTAGAVKEFLDVYFPSKE